MFDVQSRFQSLKERHRELRWYALVDGYQHEQHTGQRIESRHGINRALFQGTEDEPLVHAGPWLYDLSEAPDKVSELATLERALPCVSWLITAMDLEGLSQYLQLKLDAKLPGGKKALIRFYDPRVLGHLFEVMDVGQKALFFHLIDEWHFLNEGRRVWMGRHDA